MVYSIPGIDGLNGQPPTAIKIYLALTCFSGLPSVGVILTVFLSTNLPKPSAISTPAFFKTNSVYTLLRREISLFLASMNVSQLNVPAEAPSHPYPADSAILEGYRDANTIN